MSKTGVPMLYVRHKKIKDGLQVAIKFDDSIVPIADIGWSNKRNDCYIKTIDSRLQDYIVSWETFADFVKILDEGYDMMRAAHHKKIEQKDL